ncbi:SigE family RNA polymerase sigma factor [Kitasatospora phosalacinea]|uniref:RNA polymerase n=1 Tax=Kitasatospora phosalacinea TaxID=2065 RepID=A0A9W6UMT0_9ACTN|nr:SigE family RNA polymerase sigma factor [Kitasatospora phosalacinea]GLW54089.1 RNA polymerase [Kitasatospora phosalacinea]
MADWTGLLSELVATRGTELNRYGFLLTGDRAEAADLVQEALVRVFARPHRSWELGRLEGYVRRTMLNRFLDQHRRRQRYALLVPKVAGPEADADHSGPVADRLRLLTALDALSPAQRACVVLRYYEDLSVAGVADRLGCREGTVKRHLSDGLARLGAALGTDRRAPEEGGGA